MSRYRPGYKQLLLYLLKCLSLLSLISQTNSCYVQVVPDGHRPRLKVPPRLRCATQIGYVQTGPDGKCICPDRPRLKVPMSRPSQTESGYVQTIVRSKLFMRSSCVLRAFEGKYVQTIPHRNGICPDFSAFMSRPSCAPNQIRAFDDQFLVRPCPDHRAFMSRLSCVRQTEKNYILWCSAIP